MSMQYIGARYVPRFAEPTEWQNNTQYESLTVVTQNGNSYTSKKNVPAGVPVTNAEYWASTGVYNAQVEAYRQEVQGVVDTVRSVDAEVAIQTEEIKKLQYLDNYITPQMFGAKGDGTTDDTNAIQAAINAATNSDKITLFFPDGVYLVNGCLTINGKIRINGTYSTPYNNNDLAGFFGSIIYTTVSSDEPVIKIGYLDQPEGTTRFGIKIENICIMSPRNNNVTRDAIHSYNAGWEFAMHNVFIRYFRGHALYLYNQYDSSITNCTFTNCGYDDGTTTKYTVVLDDGNTDYTNAVKFTNCHFEHGKMFVDLQRARECIFTACKFENSDNNYVNPKPVINISKHALLNIFNGCTFMCQSNYPEYIISNTERGTVRFSESNIIGNCTFTSSGGSGCLFIKNDYSALNISNCTFSLCSGTTYPIDVSNTNMSNCSFFINGNSNNDIYGIKIKNTQFSNSKILVNDDTLTFDYTNNNIFNIGYYCTISGIGFYKAYDYANNNYPLDKYYTLENEFINSSFTKTYGIHTIQTITNDTINLEKANSNTIIIKSAGSISTITGGMLGESVRIVNESSGTINLVATATYDGTKLAENKTIDSGSSIVLTKGSSRWS